MSQTFKWERKAAGRWVLKAANGEIAAVVTRWTEVKRTAFRATLVGVDRSHSSVAKYGKLHWTTASTVAAAKDRIVAYAAMHSWSPVAVGA